MYCKHCGQRLHRDADGEAYCPDCLAFTVAALPDDDETERPRLVAAGQDGEE